MCVYIYIHICTYVYLFIYVCIQILQVFYIGGTQDRRFQRCDPYALCTIDRPLPRDNSFKTTVCLFPLSREKPTPLTPKP